MIVADVNLIAYLILGGPQRELAQRVLMRDPDWSAPLLWRSEFRSVLTAFVRQRDLALADALRAHGLAEQLLAGNEFTVSGERIMALVAGSACSAYDCEYVALAEELDLPLVTADREILRAFPDRAISPMEFTTARG